jgi:CubicO group peptidase (beta-lactamase class C family)
MNKLISGIIIGAAISFGGLYVTDNFNSPENSPPIIAQPLSPLAQELDQMFRDTYPADRPGASVIVTKGDQIILSKGYGLADIEHNIPLKPNMPLRLGSLTKQFTAVGILMLEQEGLLKVTDNINVHLPDFPTQGETITIENLLSHTSGIHNYTAMADFMEKNGRLDLTTEEMINGFKDEPLDFKPGEKYSYSNSGYVVLGSVIEKLSGQSYPDFISKRIFEPLGMTNSHYGGYEKVIPLRVKGYNENKDGLKNAYFMSMKIPHAAGALLASTEDLLKWNKALISGSLVPRDSLERAWTSTIFNNGKPVGYGYGWGTGAIDTKKVVQHSGGIPGFIAYAITIPEDDIYVAVLTNNIGSIKGPGLAQKAAAMVLGDPIIDKADSTITPESLTEYIGSYETDSGDVSDLSMEEEGLTLKQGERPGTALVPTGKDTFLISGGTTNVHFERTDEGGISKMVTTRWGRTPQGATRK